MAGCPVLISDRTPWRNLEQHGVGWTVSLSEPERFQAILQHCIDATEEEYQALAQRLKVYREALLCDTIAVDANRRMFQFTNHYCNLQDHSHHSSDTNPRNDA